MVRRQDGITMHVPGCGEGTRALYLNTLLQSVSAGLQKVSMIHVYRKLQIYTTLILNGIILLNLIGLAEMTFMHPTGQIYSERTKNFTVDTNGRNQTIYRMCIQNNIT